MTKERQLHELLEKQSYAFCGRHSAVKICTWTKKSLRNEDVCYKQKFYGIKSHRCCQISPVVGFCQNRCIFCWREIGLTLGTEMKEWDEPEKVIRNAIEMQKKQLTGFGGNDKTGQEKLDEAFEPMHFAISLTGEPTIYPKLNEMIRLLHDMGKTTFVVSNGMLPERIAEIEPPTQLYLSVDGPTKEIFEKVDQPRFRDGWERLNSSLRAMRTLKEKTRTTLRLTLILGYNMEQPEKWAELIETAQPMFVEVKAYMFVGSSRLRLTIENMPRHNEVRDFSEQICRHCGYKIVDEKEESRVLLLMKEDSPDRIMKF
jgi:tRNA wybutosine-synthesizing protein 1